jgi:bifunctional DNase/RNase
LKTKKEDVPMVEMKVDDVLVRVAGDQQEVVGEQRVVVLAERAGDRLIAIWIGAPEGDALALRLTGNATPRPMTFDLMAEMLRTTGARIEHVNVTALRDRTFYATVALAVDGRIEEVDARPSDAINLAVRVGASIFADEGVLTEEGVPPDRLPEKLARDEGREEGDVPAGEWVSLSHELLTRLRPRFVEKRP